MPKLDKIEYQRRLFIIQGWIIEGVQSSLIVRQIISSGWTNAKKLKDQQRSAERMLKVARDQWTETEECAIEQKRRIRVDEMKQYKRSLLQKYKGTPSGIFALISVDKEINKLENLYPPKKVEVTGKDGQTIKTENVNFNVTLTEEDIKRYSDILEKEV